VFCWCGRVSPFWFDNGKDRLTIEMAEEESQRAGASGDKSFEDAGDVAPMEVDGGNSGGSGGSGSGSGGDGQGKRQGA